MKRNIFTTAKVAGKTGFSVRQLDYWARRGIVVPSVQQAHGSGTRRLYGFDDLVQLRFIRRLISSGWSLQKIGKCIDLLKSVMNDPNPLRSAVLIHGGNTILAICKTEESKRVLVDTLSSSGQQVMWILLEVLKQESEDDKINTYDEIDLEIGN